MAGAATARKKEVSVAPRKQRTRRGLSAGSASTYFKPGNPGKKKGAKNKVTVVQRETARQMFTPMAELGLQKGNAHLDKCKLDGCVSCQFWAKLSFEYAYGKPTQPIEFDVVALRTELESIAVAAGKSVEEIAREAREAGVRVMADYQGAAMG